MHTETHAKRWRRGVTRGLTLGTAAATALATLMIAPAAQAADASLDNPKAPSAAHGQALALDGLGLPLLGAAGSTSEFGGQQGGLAGLDLSVLGQEIKLGTITLPLLKDPNNPNSNGLLELGDASLLRGYSATAKKSSAVASSGVITDEGGLNLADAPNDELNSARVDLTALLAQLGISGITNGIIDELSLELGAVGARVEKTDGKKVNSEYAVAGLQANVGAPLVGGLTTGLDGVVSTVGGVLNGLVGEGGLVDGVLGTLEKVLNVNLVVLSLKSDGVRAQVNGLDTLVENVLDELLRTPLQNSTGSVHVNLSDGTVTLDLAELAIEGNGYTNLNDLPANTSLLNDKTITAVTNGLTEALLGNQNPESLMSKLTAILTDHLWNSVSIDIFIDAKVKALLGILPIADTTVQLTGTLAEFTGYDGASLGDDNVKFELDLLGILPLGKLIEPIVKPLLKVVAENITGPLLTVVTQDVIGQLQPLLSGVVSGLLTPLLQTLEPVLEQVATVTVNEQTKSGEQGDLGAGSHTTNAVAVKVLPLLGESAVSLELGNASVKAADAVAELSVSPNPVKQGGKVTIKGQGYGASETVTIKSALGADKTVQTNADGAFSAEWAVPAKQAAGSVKFTATGATSKRTANATVTVESSSTGANASTNSDASTNTSGTSNSTTNANASASASAAADGQATAAAKASAQADASTSASAKATANAQAAAKAAATTNASTTASAKAEAAAKASAQVAANSKSDSDSNANSTAAANSNASAAAKAAANQNASTNASSKASADSNSSSNANGANSKADVNASASAAADSNANAAAKAAAKADATTTASAKATASANAAAKAAADPAASTKASAKANASSKAAAEAAANHKGDSDTNAKASAKANSNASAAAKAAAIADASSDASGKNPNPNTSKCITPNPKAAFLDTPTSHKFYTEIDWMYCMKYTTGIKSDAGLIYGPQMRLSREAMAAFIFRMEADPKYKAPKVSPFADMKPGDKFYREIAWMHEEGLSTGIKQASGKPFYGPKMRLTREAMAAFIYRLEAPNYTAFPPSKMQDMKPGDKFYTEISWMVDEGLSTGIRVENGDREYWPKSKLSREAMAAFIYRLVNDYRA